MEVVDEEFCATHELKFKSIINKGGFGIVYLVYSTHYQQDFALKRVLQSNFKQDEVKTMMMMQSPHICNLYQYYYFDNYVYLLLEYCPHSLIEVLGQYETVPLDIALKYIYQIMLGIEICHDHNIAHSDIKPANVLIGAYGRAKLCDFGLASQIDPHGSHTFQGSLCFMAPEILKGIPYDAKKADIWALGVTCYFIVTKQYPFNPRMSTDMLTNMISQGLYDESKIENLGLRQLITKCLKINPQERPNIHELFYLPIFKEFNMAKTLPLRLSKLTPTHTTIGGTTKLSSLIRHHSAHAVSARNVVLVPTKLKRITPFMV